MIRNRCADAFRDTAEHVAVIGSANDYLTLSWGSRFFMWSLSMRALDSPCVLLCGCDV